MNVSYSLKNNSEDIDAFSIDTSTGEVTLIDNPNYEIQSSYSVTIIATDLAGNLSEQSISLNISEVNEQPTALSFINAVAALPENMIQAARLNCRYRN